MKHICPNKIEFEKTWEDMIDTYAIHDHSWLDTIYKLKGKLAKVLHEE